MGEVEAHAVVAVQVPEHLHEPSPERVDLDLVPGPGDPGAPPHQRVEVCGERQPAEPGLPGPVERQRTEVVGVEVAMGHRHRLAAVGAHRGERSSVVLGVEQRDLAADQLGVRPRAAPRLKQAHLGVDLCDGVASVDPHLVGVLGVVAGRAGEVALREDAVRALAPHRVAAEDLLPRPDAGGQGGPALGKDAFGDRVHRPGGPLQPCPQGQHRHGAAFWLVDPSSSVSGWKVTQANQNVSRCR